MRPSLALDQNRSAIREATIRRRAANPRVFGSAARGTDHHGSDLDYWSTRFLGRHCSTPAECKSITRKCSA